MSIPRTHLKGWLFGAVLVAVGIAAGLVLSAGFGGQTIGPIETKAFPPAAKPSGLAPDFVELAKLVKPSVVNISTTKKVSLRGMPSPHQRDPFFDFFGGDPFRDLRPPRQRREQSLGSGVIISADGVIVTNNHVVEKAEEIKVLLPDKREFKGKVLGSDPKTDLAVIKIEAKDLPAARWGDSDALQVGEYVLAVGSPYGLSQTVTMGIVSAVGRANVGIADYEDFIQTDAAINPGNSGGPLVNVRGEVVGINTAIFSRSGGYQGIGFAAPSNMVHQVVGSLRKTGKVVRGYIGVMIQDVTPDLAKEFGAKELKGALVADVAKGGPAEKAGFKAGDVVLQFNGKVVEDVAQLRNTVAGTPVGTKIQARVLRDKKEKTVEVVVGELPKEAAERPGEGAEDEPGGDALDGISVQTLTPETAERMNLDRGEQGVVVARVEQDSAWGRAGLRRGDVIQQVNHRKVRTAAEFKSQIDRLKKGQTALFLVNRGGRKLFVTMKMGE